MSASSTRPAAPGEIDGDPFDRYTAAHAAVGWLYARAGVGFVPMLVLAVGWELAEQWWLKDAFPSAPWHRGADGVVTQDTLANAVGDVAAVIAGWAIGRR